ncbi:MAG: lytic murein transglycosylase B [Proteobacteria bacterium]|jgi:membrane-bound lytic murein transglycosylase B|nr:lytic murein transglycosylase B [Pseudomonadota bacterium]
MMYRPLLLLIFLVSGTALAETRQPDTAVVNQFVEEMARQHKFNAKQLQQLFQQARIQQSILDAISRPAESKPWYEYRLIFLTADRSRGGVEFWKNNAATLTRAKQIYGVPEEILIAIIGVETRYGKNSGNYRVLDALSTLAFAYPPRSQFFRKELTEYLLMAREEGLAPAGQLGSYAGAMGMPQFIPSSFRRYAVDFDNDGKRNLWTDNADVIGSVANYFKQHRWQPGEPVVVPVKVHGERYKQLLDGDLTPRYTPQQLMDNGVILPKGLSPDLKGSLIKLDGRDGPEYWVGWHNFYVISRYNHSALYSMAVYQLSQDIKSRRMKLASESSPGKQ